jgi:hypothetical protein
MVLAGACLFVFAAVLLVASRRIELAILAQHGLKSHLQYAKYIQDEEEQSHLKAHHMDATSLKVRRCNPCSRARRVPTHTLFAVYALRVPQNAASKVKEGRAKRGSVLGGGGITGARASSANTSGKQARRVNSSLGC